MLMVVPFCWKEQRGVTYSTSGIVKSVACVKQCYNIAVRSPAGGLYKSFYGLQKNFYISITRVLCCFAAVMLL